MRLSPNERVLSWDSWPGEALLYQIRIHRRCIRRYSEKRENRVASRLNKKRIFPFWFDTHTSRTSLAVLSWWIGFLFSRKVLIRDRVQRRLEKEWMRRQGSLTWIIRSVNSGRSAASRGKMHGGRGDNRLTFIIGTLEKTCAQQWGFMLIERIPLLLPSRGPPSISCTISFSFFHPSLYLSALYLASSSPLDNANPRIENPFALSLL